MCDKVQLCVRLVYRAILLLLLDAIVVPRVFTFVNHMLLKPFLKGLNVFVNTYHWRSFYVHYA